MITVNEKTYRLDFPPVVGICLDGTAPAYLDAARECMPNLARMAARGARGIVNSVIPSLTNPNNVSIATGVPPDVHGICGNYYYDNQTGNEVMMNDPAYLCCPTLFSALSRTGRSTAVVTAKDKLCALLGHNMEGICFSVERAREAYGADERLAFLESLHGKRIPGIYDPEASIYCLEAGVALLESGSADLLYLSTTDYVQHKHAPGSKSANSFFQKVDKALGRLDATGAVVALTADHGMNDKTRKDGLPCVYYLEEILVTAGFPNISVILPITDPHVRHHGALGSYAVIYLHGSDERHVAEILVSTPGVECVLTRTEAALRFHLPPERIGDLIVLGDKGTTFGRTPAWHDLSNVSTGLRSHGGLHERKVPFVINRPLHPEYVARLALGAANNYELFDFAINGAI